MAGFDIRLPLCRTGEQCGAVRLSCRQRCRVLRPQVLCTDDPTLPDVEVLFSLSSSGDGEALSKLDAVRRWRARIRIYSPVHVVRLVGVGDDCFRRLCRRKMIQK